jgi:hypothetical protein
MHHLQINYVDFAVTHIIQSFLQNILRTNLIKRIHCYKESRRNVEEANLFRSNLTSKNMYFTVNIGLCIASPINDVLDEKWKRSHYFIKAS